MKRNASWGLFRMASFFLLWIGLGAETGADISPRFTVAIKDAPAYPEKLPVESGYLFEAVCTLDGVSLTPDRYTLQWSATNGSFHPRYPGVYLAPAQPMTVTVTVNAVHSFTPGMPGVVTSVTFEVVPSRFLGTASPAQRSFPHIARMRVAPKMYAQYYPNQTPEDLRPCLQYLRKYSVLTVDGNQMEYLYPLRQIDAAEGTDRVCLKFTQSGGEVASYTFRLGLNANDIPYTKQLWPGFYLYGQGEFLDQDVAADSTALVLHFKQDIRSIFSFQKAAGVSGVPVGDYVVFFDGNQPPSVDNWEVAEVDPAETIGGTDGRTLKLLSRGTVDIRGRPTLLAGKPGTPHKFKVSAHAMNTTLVRPLAADGGFPDGFRINFACPLTNPDGRTVQEGMALYLLRELNRGLAPDIAFPATIYDGWKFDVTTYWADEMTFRPERLDTDLDNLTDASEVGTPESRKGHLGDGRLEFWALLREVAGNGRLIVGDNHNNRGYASLNGTEFEGFPSFMNGTLATNLPRYRNGYMTQLWSYRTQWSNPALVTHEPYTELFTKRTNGIYFNDANSDERYHRSDTNNLFRLDLCSALLENGYYLYAPHPDAMIQGAFDTWMDEFDGGRGSSMVLGLGKDDTKIQVGERPGQSGVAPFVPGEDVVIGPETLGITSPIMRVVDAFGQAFWELPVTRQTDRSRRTVQPAGSKVLTPADLLAAHQGYLGAARAPAQYLPAVLNLPPIPLPGTWENGEWKSDDVSLVDEREYTLRFNARCLNTERLTLQVLVFARITIQQYGYDTNRAVSDVRFELSAQESPCAMSFVSRGGGPCQLWLRRFQEPEAFEISGLELREGGYHIYRRDFENGIALVNATAGPVTFDLRDDLYRHIAGTQDAAVNNGQPASADYLLGAMDGRILLREEVDLATLAINPANVWLGRGAKTTFQVQARDRMGNLMVRPIPAIWTVSNTLAKIQGESQYVNQVEVMANLITPGIAYLTAEFRGARVSATITIQ